MFEISTYTGGIAETNGWVVKTEAGTILIDAPEGISAWLAAQGIKLEALLLTHQHFDHVMDAGLIQKEQGCPVYAFSAYSKGLTLETLMGSDFAVNPYSVDHVLDGKGSLSLAGWDFRLLHVPGHSLDSVCFHSAEHGLLFGGDVLFAGSIGRTDLPGGSTKQLLTGIATKLLVLDDSTRVFPGHGPETTIGDERGSNPYLE